MRLTGGVGGGGGSLVGLTDGVLPYITCQYLRPYIM